MIATETFAGTMLAGVHIDTYSMLSSDSWEERELEYAAEEGLPSDYDAYDWHYDHAGMVREFAEQSAAALVSLLGGEVLLAAEVVETWSPAYYNFTSDGYTAKWTVDMTALDAWLAERNWDLDAYVDEYHESRDGFVSHIPRRLADPRERDWTIFFLKLDAYVREELDQDEYNNWLWEGEDEVYMDHITYTLRETDEVA